MKKKLGALSGILLIIAIILILLNRQQHIPITPNPTSSPIPTSAEGRIAAGDTESEPESTSSFTPTPTPTITPTVESYSRFDISVIAEDDVGIDEVFIVIEGLDRIDLLEKNDSWQGDSKIRKEGEYPYTITVIDSSRQETTAEGNMKCILAEGDDDVDGSTGATY
jgi:hypothetical protein